MRETKNMLDAMQCARQFKALNPLRDIDALKPYYYTLIANATAQVGGTLSAHEARMLCDAGLCDEQLHTRRSRLMTLDMKKAYDSFLPGQRMHPDFTIDRFRQMASLVMRQTGRTFDTERGLINTARGDFRRGYECLDFKPNLLAEPAHISSKMEHFCNTLNALRRNLLAEPSFVRIHALALSAYCGLLAINPWYEGNRRVAQLLMNCLQSEFGELPTLLTQESVRQIVAHATKVDLMIPDEAESLYFSDFCATIESICEEYKLISGHEQHPRRFDKDVMPCTLITAMIDAENSKFQRQHVSTAQRELLNSELAARLYVELLHCNELDEQTYAEHLKASLQEVKHLLQQMVNCHLIRRRRFGNLERWVIVHQKRILSENPFF